MLGTLDASIHSKMLRAATLVAFWAALRKSNITVKSATSLGHCLTRGNVVSRPDGQTCITLTSAKNNQFRGRAHAVIIPSFRPGDPGEHLCPSRALRLLYADPAACDLPLHGPAINSRQNGRWAPLTHAQLVTFIKTFCANSTSTPTPMRARAYGAGGPPPPSARELPASRLNTLATGTPRLTNGTSFSVPKTPPLRRSV